MSLVKLKYNKNNKKFEGGKDGLAFNFFIYESGKPNRERKRKSKLNSKLILMLEPI